MGHPPLPAGLPRVIGHRGAAGSAPENTLASFRSAARQGARWVECDVRLTADGVPVLLHDVSLDRTTSGRGPLALCGVSQFRALDAGSWFGPDFRGEPPPTLAAALEECSRLELGLNLEWKAEACSAEALAAAVARELARHPRLPHLISSFEAKAAAAAATHCPDSPRGLLVERADAAARALARRLGCASLHAAAAGLDAAGVAAALAEGLAPLAYTVNDPEKARSLWSLGVSAVFTDFPARLLAPG